jgi:hypothetical protein
LYGLATAQKLLVYQIQRVDAAGLRLFSELEGDRVIDFQYSEGNRESIESIEEFITSSKLYDDQLKWKCNELLLRRSMRCLVDAWREIFGLTWQLKRLLRQLSTHLYRFLGKLSLLVTSISFDLMRSEGTYHLVPISRRGIREVWGAKKTQVMRDGIHQRIQIDFWYSAYDSFDSKSKARCQIFVL